MQALLLNTKFLMVESSIIRSLVSAPAGDVPGGAGAGVEGGDGNTKGRMDAGLCAGKTDVETSAVERAQSHMSADHHQADAGDSSGVEKVRMHNPDDHYSSSRNLLGPLLVPPNQGADTCTPASNEGVVERVLSELGALRAQLCAEVSGCRQDIAALRHEAEKHAQDMSSLRWVP